VSIPIRKPFVPRIGRSVSCAQIVARAHALRIAPIVSTSITACWNRFNTGRSFAFVVWMAVALTFLLPASPPPVEANHNGVCTYTGAGTTENRPTPRLLDYGDDWSSTAVARMPQHRTREAMLHQGENLAACWGDSCIQATKAQSVTGPLREVVVAVLDTGINAESPLLSECLYKHVSVVESEGIGDAIGHGTHIAGTIASIAPNSRIVDIKVADSRGNCTSACVAEGILRAVSDSADVINLSLEVEPSPALEAAIDCAWQRGAVIVAAAGMPSLESTVTGLYAGEQTTSGQPCRPPMSAPVYPASYQNVIAVTGTSEKDELAPACNRGEWVNLAAPGIRTFSELPGGTHGYMTGTSTAASHVSGVAALLMGIAYDENNNGRVNDEVRHAMETTARPLNIEGTGSGIVDALAAVNILQD